MKCRFDSHSWRDCSLGRQTSHLELLTWLQVTTVNYYRGPNQRIRVKITLRLLGIHLSKKTVAEFRCLGDITVAEFRCLGDINSSRVSVFG